jgi:hypothetical protein
MFIELQWLTCSQAGALEQGVSQLMPVVDVPNWVVRVIVVLIA